MNQLARKLKVETTIKPAYCDPIAIAIKGTVNRATISEL